MNLTPKKIEILDMIDRWRREHGCAPTLDEMAVKLNRNRIGVWGCIDQLVDAGYLKKTKHHARSLQLTTLGTLALPGSRCPTCGRSKDEQLTTKG